MELVNHEDLYSRLKTQAFNSSHFVWLWSDLKFIETTNGWIFAITKEMGINLIALEPLSPHDDIESFSLALNELQAYFKEGAIAFVGIYTPFAKTLSEFGFSSFQIGKEPWVDLSDIKPTGHAGRKVRVGRNQALKSGLRVEEWNLSEVIKDPLKLSLLNEVKELWEAQSFVSLSGFLHGMSFECIPSDRKCFVALTKDNIIDGILIVTPIVQEKSWYFEDTLTRASSKASKGIGELLTLTAMESLNQEGFKEISLGIVPMTTVGISEFGMAPPKNFLRLTSFFQTFLKLFYNAEGMELFRKRFKVIRWDKIYLSVLIDKKSKQPPTLQWIKVLCAVTAAYKPRLQLKLSYLLEKIFSPLKRYPTSFLFSFLSIAFFIMNTKLRVLAPFVNQEFEFSLLASLWQWPRRILCSEFIYYDLRQFLTHVFPISFILFYIEKEVFDKKWVLYLLSFFILSDIAIRTLSGFIYRDILKSEALLILLNIFPSSGGGIILASTLGFVVSLSGAKKDEWLAFSLIGIIILSFMIPSLGITAYSLLYSTAFYLGGYLFGKFYLNYQSKKDALINKKSL